MFVRVVVVMTLLKGHVCGACSSMASCLSWDTKLINNTTTNLRTGKTDTIPVGKGSRVRILRVTDDRQTNLMTGWKRETKETVGMTSVLAINRCFFVTNLWIMKTRARETDERSSERMHAHKPRACCTVLLFVFSLVVLYLWLVSNSCYFYSFFIFTILIFLQSWIWYSFSQSFCSVFGLSISRDIFISNCLDQESHKKSRLVSSRIPSVHGIIQKSLFTKLDEEARLIVQLYENVYCWGNSDIAEFTNTI